MSHKKRSEMTPKQHEKAKKADRLRYKAKKERLERENAEPMSYDQACEAFDHSPEAGQLGRFINETIQKIYDELDIPVQGGRESEVIPVGSPK